MKLLIKVIIVACTSLLSAAQTVADEQTSKPTVGTFTAKLDATADCL